MIIEGTELVNCVKDFLHEETQLHDDNFHLTLSTVYEARGRGSIDFGGSEREDAPAQKLSPTKRSPGDDYGWWGLGLGEYLIEYNEELSIPSGYFGLIEPLSRLTANGTTHSTMVVTGDSGIQTLLQVGENGLEIKENSRISRLFVLEQGK